MKAKAKRLDNGEWVEGYYTPLWSANDSEACAINKGMIYDQDEQSLDTFPVDPKTLCQQVRGTDFFEGDEVTAQGSYSVLKGYWIYEESTRKWAIKQFDDKPSLDASYFDWQPTGKNIHD